MAQVRALHEAGQSVQAWRASQCLGPLGQWPGTPAKILAARLVAQLSADRLSDALLLRAWRSDRNDPEAMLYGAIASYTTRGSLAALDLLDASGLLDADTPQRWEAMGYAAWLHATFRDFQTADGLISRAIEASPTAWAWTQQAAIHEMADRYPQALEAARRGMALDPCSRAAIQSTARLLSSAERDAEAIELLRTSLDVLESPRIAAQLASLEYETGQFHEALATLDRYDAMSPIKDKVNSVWLAGRRCDIYSRLGELPLALEQAKLASSPFYRQIALRLAEAKPGIRPVMLPVGFVRQHHVTCAPATLAALTRYWSLPANHQALAEEICYDGTPNHSQRRWAMNNGWHTREFTVTWDSARALIDAGIPFTLSTVHPGSAHLQAVIGYDEARGTLLIRDPSERVHSEFTEAPFFDSYRASGPRGMAMIPRVDMAKLDALALPDAGLYDLAHELQDALVAHERDRAAARCAELGKIAAGHRIEITARRSLACYDGDSVGHLRCVQELLASFPDDVNLRMSQAGLLRELAPHQEHLDYLRTHSEGRASHALLRLRLARTLLDDGRERASAVCILRRLTRSWCRGETLSALADAHWHAGDYPRAVALYRLAACLEPADEDHARAYFRAARMVRGEQRAIDYLRRRIEQLGSRSAQPAMTLFDCLAEIDRTVEARAVLEASLAAHPQNGSLLLFAARAMAAQDQADHVDGLLARAKGRTSEVDWLCSAASCRQVRGDLSEAMALWQRAAGAAPFELRSQRAVAGLLNELRGRPEAVQYLQTLADRFPRHQQLAELLVEWLDDAPLPEQESALQRLLDINPTNAWAQRQLALVLARQRRFEEAQARILVARELAPNSVAWHNVHGDILQLKGDRQAAREQFRQALRLSVDSDFAINQLLEACANIEERRAELAFVLAEMKRQVIYGDALLTYQRHARHTTDPEELAALLDEARAARPDLWQSWAACLRQRIELHHHDVAERICNEAMARFPMLPRLQLERAEMARVAGKVEVQHSALAEALRLSPGWSLAACRLADAIEAAGDFARSREVIESALRRSPADSVLRGYLGSALWQLGERGPAIAQLEQAVALDPGYRWGWRRLKEWNCHEGRPEAAIELARQLSGRRPGERRSWLAVADVADDPKEGLVALDRAIALSPLSLDAHEQKLDLLIELKLYDEALALVDATASGEQAHVSLQAKACSILAARGDVAAAIARMEKVLGSDPNHYVGWQSLADWHEEREDWPAALVATREMCRIAPNNPRSPAYLANALANAEPQTDIRRHLRRALHLEPNYPYAGNMLFDREVEAGDLDAAQSVLSALRAQVDNGSVRWREIRLAVLRRERKTALDLFWRMWAVREESIDPFRQAFATLVEAGWRDEAERVIEGVRLEPDANSHVGTLWIERRAAPYFKWRRFAGFDNVIVNGKVGHAAAQALLRHYSARKDAGAIRRLLRRHGEALARDNTTFGIAAYALVEVKLNKDTVAWFGDWTSRPDLKPWHLLNLVCGLRDLGRNTEAAGASRHALTCTPDHATREHTVWLAIDAALADDAAEAERLLAKVEESGLGGYYVFLLRITQALCAVSRENEAETASGYRRAIALLGGLHKLVPGFMQEPALRRVLERTLWRVARARTRHAVTALGCWVYLLTVVFL